MKSVNGINVIIFGDDVVYGSNSGENNITVDMYEKWRKMFSIVENILEDCGVNPENAVIDRCNSMMVVSLNEEFCFEEALDMLKAFEEKFVVSEFDFCCDFDDYTEIEPHVTFGIYEKSK